MRSIPTDSTNSKVVLTWFHLFASIFPIPVSTPLPAMSHRQRTVKAVKEPAVAPIRSVQRAVQLAAIRGVFRKQGTTAGSALSCALILMRGEERTPLGQEDDGNDGGGEIPWGQSLSSIEVARTRARNYPHHLNDLPLHVLQPTFPELFCRFLYTLLHPGADAHRCLPHLLWAKRLPFRERLTRRRATRVGGMPGTHPIRGMTRSLSRFRGRRAWSLAVSCSSSPLPRRRTGRPVTPLMGGSSGDTARWAEMSGYREPGLCRPRSTPVARVRLRVIAGRSSSFLFPRFGHFM
ncbi:hypothetical protein C8R47DRAFT_814517 [Mycena vitilis]|nr:hypothetical protein C8R47DRAFT_814517 [Mycena vitilis]